jgi:hypothetical protein
MPATRGWEEAIYKKCGLVRKDSYPAYNKINTSRKLRRAIALSMDARILTVFLMSGLAYLSIAELTKRTSSAE